MAANRIDLIEYSKKVDFCNSLTHAVGAVLSVPALIMLLMKAEGFRSTVSAAIFGLSLLAVYTVSAVYHGLPQGEAKRTARRVDHSTVPTLIAGTATPCALVTLYNISVVHATAIVVLAWGCTLFGLISKLFFFEKTRSATVAAYIGTSLLMLCSAIPVLGKINTDAFGGIVLGNAFYLVGALFCGIGRKKPVFHVVFHIFALIASAIHFYVIYLFII
ncbi:MAG: hemolysin III family protein [Clostridia bacterium]|nr:hemolysin III family protein [Clostridia bacterium]